MRAPRRLAVEQSSTSRDWLRGTSRDGVGMDSAKARASRRNALVQPSNYPTQAKTGLEWAARQERDSSRDVFGQRDTPREILRSA